MTRDSLIGSVEVSCLVGLALCGWLKPGRGKTRGDPIKNCLESEKMD